MSLDHAESRDTVIETRGLTRTYVSGSPGRRKCVEAVLDLDLTVRAGEIVAFLGPNGAGKTTTINVLMGLLRPTRGSVTVFGGRAYDPRAHARIGYLPENYAFHGWLTAPGLLDFFGRLFRLPAPVRRSRIETLLHRLGLEEARDRAIARYSRGMRQRLGIAQALLNAPDLLILDEPTSGFDPIGRRMVRELLLEERNRGAAIFLSSHILSEVESVCDRVVILNHGRLVTDGRLADVVGARAGFEIQFAEPGDEARRLIEMTGTPVEIRGALVRVVVPDEDEAQRTIDVIRECRGLVKSYAPITPTLEDAFLRDIREDTA